MPTINGTNAHDTLVGDKGDDRIYGRDGNDQLSGRWGNDSLYGGAGADSLDGGAGIDLLSYAGSNAGVSVSLATGTVLGGHAQGDTISGFEEIEGSDYADTLWVAGPGAAAYGGGNDTLHAGGGGRAYGGAGNDLLRAGLNRSSPGFWGLK